MNTLLVLNIRPELEEDMVDYLLAQEGVRGFTSYQVRGHGVHEDLSLAEQVSGRRRRLQFELVIEESKVAGILANLKSSVGRDIVYWQHSISNVGRIE